MKRPGFLKRGERVRLQTFLARSGVSSRRAAEEMITHGRISVNGDTVTAMGLQVVPGVDRVEVDGVEVKVAPTTWLALHKPKGYVTTRTDPFGRETVYALLPEKYHGLFHVGRLDRDSEGLLLLTNDGELANRFLHPSFGITKEYDVIVTGKPTDAALRQLVEGVELEDGTARAESAKLIGPAGNGQSRLKLVLREGKKREVRRMMEAVGHDVTRLIRRRFGPVDLAELPKGKWRIVAPEELAQVREPRRAARPARDEAAGAAAGDAPPRRASSARASHNAYGGKPVKRHGKAGAAKDGAGKDGPGKDGPGKHGPAKGARAQRDGEDRPRARPSTGERKPARPGKPGAKGGERKPSARPPVDADAPPRRRPAAPARTHAAELDDWADAPRGRAGGDDRARGPRDDRTSPPRSRGKGDERRPGPRGKPGPRGHAAGGSARDERPAGPRGKPGPRDRAAGGFDRDERPAGPRGRPGPRDRAAGGFDRDERPAGPRGKPGPRDRAAGGFGRDEHPAGPRGRAPDHEGRSPGPRGVKPSPPRERTPAEEPDELDEWGTTPRRSSGSRGGKGSERGAPRPPRGSPPARGGKPGGKPGGGKPGARGGPGKPRSPGGGGKPRKPGGGGKPRGR